MKKEVINKLESAKAMAHLQRTMNWLYVACDKYGLEMNVKKTKFIFITNDQADTRNNEFK